MSSIVEMKNRKNDVALHVSIQEEQNNRDILPVEVLEEEADDDDEDSDSGLEALEVPI